MTQSDPMDVKWPFIVVVCQHRLDGFLQRCEVNLLRLRDKTLDKRDVNFDSKVAQETCLFNAIFGDFEIFLDKKTHVGNV